MKQLGHAKETHLLRDEKVKVVHWYVTLDILDDDSYDVDSYDAGC